MIRYIYKNPRILFVGINPHPGSFERGVPFSNNKLFWYLLSEAGILEETRDELRDDERLKRVYTQKFSAIYRLGFVNLIDRPTRDITGIKKGEEVPGRRKISRIIKREAPNVVCFIGKVAYEKYTGSKDFTFGWQNPIDKSKAFVMHFPLRGEAVVRVLELRKVVRASRD
jgi:TDG/mug DNA glycosylase family protein